MQDELSARDFARLFSHTPESVAVAQLVSLWRRFPAVRMLVTAALEKPDPLLAMQFFAALGIGASAGVADDFPNLVRTRFPAACAAHSYGGLSLEKLISLMRRYKSGRNNPGAYLFLCHWKRELALHRRSMASGIDPRIVELTVEAFRRAISAGNSSFFQRLADAMDTMKTAKEFSRNGRWDHNPVENKIDVWRYGLLLYMRNHPKRRYRMREFRRHLEDELGQEAPDRKTIRRFCRQNGIALDTSPGSPGRPGRQPGELLK